MEAREEESAMFEGFELTTVDTGEAAIRAGATIDFRIDEADRGRRRIACPVLVLWSRCGELEKWYDVLAVWRDWADDVSGRALDCRHYLAEEAPEETYDELRRFLAG